MIDVVDFNTGEVLKEGAPSRAAAVDWINHNFKIDHWSIVEEDEDMIALDLPTSRWSAHRGARCWCCSTPRP